MTATKEENYPSPILEDSFNPDQTKLIIFIKNNENLTIGDKNLTIKETKVNLSNGELTIQTYDDIIKNSNYKTDVKANLLKIDNSFRNKMFFGRDDIVQLLNCSSGAAFKIEGH